MLKVCRVFTQFLRKQLTVRTITVSNKNAPHKSREEQTNFKHERNENNIITNALKIPAQSFAESSGYIDRKSVV